MHRGGQAASSEEVDAEAMTSGRIERAGEKRRLHQNEFTKKKKRDRRVGFTSIIPHAIKVFTISSWGNRVEGERERKR